MTTAARLQLLAARGREASAAKQAARDARPFVPPRVPQGATCPECGGGCHADRVTLTCPDCGEFDRDGRGNWARRGHSRGLAIAEVLGFAAPLLPDLPGRTVLTVDRGGDLRKLDAHDDLTAHELRRYVGTVSQWLESRGEWLRDVEVIG